MIDNVKRAERILSIVENYLATLSEAATEFEVKRVQGLKKHTFSSEKIARIQEAIRREKASDKKDQLSKLKEKLKDARRELRNIEKAVRNKKGKWVELPDEVHKLAAAGALDPDSRQYSLAIHIARGMLAEALRSVTESQIDDEITQVLIERIGVYHMKLNNYIYYSQQFNLNFLYKWHKKNEAWARTCNMTSLAMALSSIGITHGRYKWNEKLIPFDTLTLEEIEQSYSELRPLADTSNRRYRFLPEVHNRLIHIYLFLRGEAYTLNDAEMTGHSKSADTSGVDVPSSDNISFHQSFNFEDIWRKQIFQLNFPDFIQLCVIDNEIDNRIKTMGKPKALGENVKGRDDKTNSGSERADYEEKVLSLIEHSALSSDSIVREKESILCLARFLGEVRNSAAINASDNEHVFGQLATHFGVKKVRIFPEKARDFIDSAGKNNLKKLKAIRSAMQPRTKLIFAWVLSEYLGGKRPDPLIISLLRDLGIFDPSRESSRPIAVTFAEGFTLKYGLKGKHTSFEGKNFIDAIASVGVSDNNPSELEAFKKNPVLRFILVALQPAVKHYIPTKARDRFLDNYNAFDLFNKMKVSYLLTEPINLGVKRKKAQKSAKVVVREGNDKKVQKIPTAFDKCFDAFDVNYPKVVPLDKYEAFEKYVGNEQTYIWAKEIVEGWHEHARRLLVLEGTPKLSSV